MGVKLVGLAPKTIFDFVGILSDSNESSSLKDVSEDNVSSDDSSSSDELSSESSAWEESSSEYPEDTERPQIISLIKSIVLFAITFESL